MALKWGNGGGWRTMDAALMVLPLLIVFASMAARPAGAINCYTCSSVNGSDINCEDPFNPAMSTYKEKCMVPKQGHVGVFPANFCIKIRGTDTDTSVVTFIRACAMKTMDSQCGLFRYQDHLMSGCILTCDYDGCNAAPAAFSLVATSTALGVLLAALALR